MNVEAQLLEAQLPSCHPKCVHYMAVCNEKRDSAGYGVVRADGVLGVFSIVAEVNEMTCCNSNSIIVKES